MKKPFNVLDRSLSFNQHYLLEASAGTGKTFSIQNLVVRLLIEPRDDGEPLPLPKILIVTFTRAATRDLKTRIRSNIEQALAYLEEKFPENLTDGSIPDYLKACLEKGDKAVNKAKKRLQEALFIFDQAQILTIHSFCAHMLRQFALESDMGLHVQMGEDPLPQTELMVIIRDFFRTEIREDSYSAAQIGILLNIDPDQTHLLRLVKSGHAFPSFPPFKQLYFQFIEEMQQLKETYSLTSQILIQEFQNQAIFYRNYSQETKAETLTKIIRFAKLFDQTQWSRNDFDLLIKDGLIWIQALNPTLMKKQLALEETEFSSSLYCRFKSSLQPIIEEARNDAHLLARVAADCRSYLRRFQQEEENFSPDDILRKMDEALAQPYFLEKVQSHYQAAIVDEFQDTDPLQWGIFKRLFLPESRNWKGFLTLVGDPKQSIYSFRQADIYTYFDAAQEIGKENSFSLNTNYRSQATLVGALNQLFSEEHLPHFIPLPKSSTVLNYHPVLAADQNREIKDERGAVHFFIAQRQTSKLTLQDFEATVFFPFLSLEIFRLNKQKDFAYGQFAVLVRDRYQALRLANFFKQVGIPFQNQRGTTLADSLALQSLIHLMQALLHFQERGAVLAAFGSHLMGWSCEELKHPEAMEFMLLLLQRLKFSLKEKGFAAFFQDLLHSTCKPRGKTVLEQLLERKNGLEFYRELQQIADHIVDHQYIEWNSPEGIIPFLDNFQIWEENEDKRVKQLQDPSEDGVKILTLHVSKGLEFDVVFALGLLNRFRIKETLFPIESKGQYTWTPLMQESQEYQNYCEEIDSEKMRQLYVALTRAKYQLYIPVVLALSSHQLQWGEASPLDLFLARLYQSPASYTELYERIKSSDGSYLIEFIEKVGRHHSITYSMHDEVFCEIQQPFPIHINHNLIEPKPVAVPGKPLWVTSFTALSHKIELPIANQLSILKVPNNYQNEDKNIHTLPASSETGLLIHRILEKVVFKDFEKLPENSQISSFLRPFLQNPVYQQWEEAIANLVINALTTPFPQLEGNFSLSMLTSSDFYREMPFLFPYQQEEGIEDIEFKEGLMKGVIDLLFIYGGQYYLLDWKTNWLGPQVDCYDYPSMLAAMDENAYFLQATIYTEAIKRYLKIVEPRPFEECFGGAFYLFLRGMQPDQQTGIFHFLPHIHQR